MHGKQSLPRNKKYVLEALVNSGNFLPPGAALAAVRRALRAKALAPALGCSVRSSERYLNEESIAERHSHQAAALCQSLALLLLRGAKSLEEMARDKAAADVAVARRRAASQGGGIPAARGGQAARSGAASLSDT